MLNYKYFEVIVDADRDLVFFGKGIRVPTVEEAEEYYILEMNRLGYNMFEDVRELSKEEVFYFDLEHDHLPCFGLRDLDYYNLHFSGVDDVVGGWGYRTPTVEEAETFYADVMKKLGCDKIKMIVNVPANDAAFGHFFCSDLFGQN